jgi:hypothetical protein
VKAYRRCFVHSTPNGPYVSRQRSEEFSDRELRVLQRTAVEHALTAGRGPTGLELAGALERLRSDQSGADDGESSVTTGEPPDGIGVAVPLTALAVVYASESSVSGDGGAAGIDRSPWGPDWVPRPTETEPPPEVVGAAVACCRFEVTLARAARAVGRSPELVARAGRSLDLE